MHPRRLAAILLVSTVPAAAAAPVANKPRTLVHAKGPITGFAQDGGRIAWQSVEASNRRCPYLVRIRTLAAKKQTAVVRAGGLTCRFVGQDIAPGPQGFALAGDRAIWLLRESGNNQYIRLVSGSLRAPRDRQVGNQFIYSNADSSNYALLLGDGGTIVAAYYRAAQEDTEECNDAGNCRYLVSEGGLFRLAGLRLVRVRGTPPAALAALSGSRVAIVTIGRPGEELDRSMRNVEVRDVRSGTLRGRFLARSEVRAIAVGGSTVAALTSRTIDRYTVSGRLVGSTPVPARTAPELSMSESRIVYRVGRSIRTIAATTGPSTVVATAKQEPGGLSIEGNRIAWAENLTRGGATRGRIQAIDLR